MARIEAGRARELSWLEPATDLTEDRDPRDPALRFTAAVREPAVGWELIVPEVERLLESLPQSDARLLRMRFGIGEPDRDAEEIGRELGVSTAEAREWEQRALRRLRLLSLEPASTARSAVVVALPARARHRPRPSGD